MAELKKIECENLSKDFYVRELTDTDSESIFEMCRENTIFYQYHPPFVSKESILNDMKALPPGKRYEDKFYMGFFEGDRLVAVMDLILNYPEYHIAYIGFFMVNAKYQNAGIGSKIVCDSLGYLREEGFEKVRIGVDKGNPQSFAFWKKNGFSVVSEGEYIRMETSYEKSSIN